MGSETYVVTSPVMGTFYRSAAPGEPSLVEEGQKISEGDMVCIIESMKIFTELRSEKSGTVGKILVDNEEAVMKNQALIEIIPD